MRLRKILEMFNLKKRQCHVLFLLRSGLEITPGGIRKELGILPPAVTRTLKELEQKGLIGRKLGNDRRTLPCFLTEKECNVLKGINAKWEY